MNVPRSTYSVEEVSLEEISSFTKKYDRFSSQQYYYQAPNVHSAIKGALMLTTLFSITSTALQAKPIVWTGVTNCDVIATNRILQATSGLDVIQSLDRYSRPVSQYNTPLKNNIELAPNWLELGEPDFDAEPLEFLLFPNLEPAVSDIVKVFITNTSWAEPAMKDLDEEPSYALDELF